MAVLPRPPLSPSLDPLDPEAIIDDARALPRFRDQSVRNLAHGLSTGKISPEQGRKIVGDIGAIERGEASPLGPAPLATVETDTGPIFPDDRRSPQDRVREQNAIRATFNRELPAPDEIRRQTIANNQELAALMEGRRAPPQVKGPAMRAIDAANERGGAALPRPPGVQPEAALPTARRGGMTPTQRREANRSIAARHNAITRAQQQRLSPSAASQAALIQGTNPRRVADDDPPEVLTEKANAVARGEGGGLFASAKFGVLAGATGIAESVGTILRYLGGTTGLEGVAALGESVEDFWRPRMQKYVESANLPQGNVFENPKLLWDADFLTFNIMNFMPSLVFSMGVGGLAGGVVRKAALAGLARAGGGRIATAGAEAGSRVDVAAGVVGGLGRAAERVGKATQAGEKVGKVARVDQIIKIGNRSIDVGNPVVQAKLIRIGKASFGAMVGLGGLAGGLLEGSSTYRETFDALIEQGIPEEIARETAENNMLAMTAWSGVLNAVGIGRIIKAAPGPVSRLISGFVEAITEYLEEPGEVLIKIGTGVMTVEEGFQQLMDGTNVLLPALVVGAIMPGAGAGFTGRRHDGRMSPAEAAAAEIDAAEEGELPPVDPGAGPAGGALNVTTEEASGTAKANQEEVDETTVQEPDEPAPTTAASAPPVGVPEGGGVIELSDAANTTVDTRLTLEADQRRSAPAVREDGRVELTHYSRVEGIETLDPSFSGTGIRGAEAERKERHPEHWVDRTYYGLSVGEPGGYQKETGLGPVTYTSSVDPTRLYDYKRDPLELFDVDHPTFSASTRYEKAIKEAGFAGYWVEVSGKNGGLVSAIFETRDVGPTTQETQDAAAIRDTEAKVSGTGTQREGVSGEGGADIQQPTGRAGRDKKPDRGRQARGKETGAGAKPATPAKQKAKATGKKAATAKEQAAAPTPAKDTTAVVTGFGQKAPDEIAAAFNDPAVTLNKKTLPLDDVSSEQLTTALQDVGLPSSGNKTVKRQRLFDGQVTAATETPEAKGARKDKELRTRVLAPKTDDEFSAATSRKALVQDAEALGIAVRSKDNKATIAKQVREVAAQAPVPIAAPPAAKGEAKEVSPNETIQENEAEVIEAHAKAVIGEQDAIDFDSTGSGVPAPAPDAIIERVSAQIQSEPLPEADITEQQDLLFREDDIRDPNRNKSGERRRNQLGDFAGAPEGVKTERDVSRLVRLLTKAVHAPNALIRQLAERGTFHRKSTLFWYEKSAAEIRKISKDPAVREQLTRLFAIYSQRNNVRGNTTAAVQAIHQYLRGAPEITAGRFPNILNHRIDEFMKMKEFNASDVPNIGKKIMSFYRNLSDAVNDTDTFANEVTIDMWMMKLLGYETIAPSDAQYAFAREMVISATEAFNTENGTDFKPRQIQAALWTKVQNDEALAEQDRRDEIALAGQQGTIEQIKARGTKAVLIEEARVLNNKLKPEQLQKLSKTQVAQALKKAANTKPKVPDAFKPSTEDFQSLLQVRTAQVTAEFTPSTQLESGVAMAAASNEEKDQYAADMVAAMIDKNGTDELAGQVGILLGSTATQAGGFEQSINPNQTTGVISEQLKGAKAPQVDQVNVYSLAVQYLYRQDSVPWVRVAPGLRGRANPHAWKLEFDEALTPAQETELMHRLTSEVHADMGFSRLDGGVYVIANYRDSKGKPFGLPDDAFNARMKKFFNGVNREVGSIESTNSFRAEGELHAEGINGENWGTHPEGDWVLDRIVAEGRSDLLPWLRRRRKLLDGITKRAVGRIDERNDARFAKTEAERSEQRPVRSSVPLARLIKTATDAVVEITGRFGTFSGKNTQEQTKVYPLGQLATDPQQVLDQAAQHGYLVKFFSFVADKAAGVDVVIPRLKQDGYDNGTVWIYNPRNPEGSFKDEAYTTAWRVTHEVAHAITNQFMQTKYGDSTRYGRLGRTMVGERGTKDERTEVELEALTLMEAQRAVEWEQVAFRAQRLLLGELGIEVTDEQFNQENRINFADAMYRALTGEFAEAGASGFVAETTPIDVKDILISLEETEALLAQDQGRDPTSGINLNTWKQVTDAALTKAITEAKSNGNPNPTAQATATGQSGTDAILTEADISTRRSDPAVTKTDRATSAASGAAAQLDNAKETDEPLNSDDRVLHADDPKRSGEEPAGMEADEARFAILDVINTMSSVVKINVVQSQSDLPFKRKGKRVRGVFNPKTNEVWIVADNMHNAADVERIILHEVFGHYAMRNLPQFAVVQKQVQEIIDRGGDPVMAQVVADVSARGSVPQAVFIEEVIAHLAETSTSRGAAMQEVIARMKAFIRQLGFKTQPSSADVMAIIRASRRRAQKRALAAAGIGIDRGSEQYQKFLKSGNLKDLRRAANDDQVGAALQRLATEFDAPLFSDAAPMNEDLDSRWKKVMNIPLQEEGLQGKIKRKLQMFHDLSWDEMTQGIFDSGNSVASGEISVFGRILDSSVSAYKAFSTIRNMNNVMGAVMRHGIPALETTTLEIKDVDGKTHKVTGRNFVEQEGAQSFNEIFTPLGQIEGDSQMRNWEKWAVARRSRRLLDEDIKAGRQGEPTAREKLLDEELVDETLQWARDRTATDGRTYEAVFEEVFTNWDKFNQANLDLAIATGVLDEKTAKLFREFEYVPFWRELTQLESRSKPGAGRDRIDVKGAGLFRQRGGVDREGNPLKLEGNVVESMFMNTAYLLERSYRNESMTRIAENGVRDGTMTKAPQVARPAITVSKLDLVQLLWKSGLINADTADSAEAEFNKWSDTDQDRWETFWTRLKPPGDDIVTVMVKGKPTYYTVEDRLLMKTIGGMTGMQQNMLMTMMRGSKKWLTIGVTTDPAFMIANWMRDTVSSLIVSDAPINSMADPIKALREAFNDSPAMLHLAFAGRGGGGFYDTNPEQIRDLLKQMKKPGDAESIDSFMNTIVSPRKMWRFWRRVGTASEFGNRVRIYNARIQQWETAIEANEAQGMNPQAAAAQAIKDGVASPAEAAFQAQDLLNFTRSGDFAIIQGLVQTVPFLNARLQGLNKFYRGYKENPLGFMKKAGSLMMLSIAYALIADEDDRYKALAEWDKDTYYHFWFGDEHFRIPKPFEAGVLFSTVPERIVLQLKGSEGFDVFVERMMAAVTQTFAFNPLPQAIRPMLEQYHNTNFFTKQPILSMGQENLVPAAQYDYRTGSFARAVGDALPDIAPNVLQSPKRLEALIKGYFGALGVYTLGIANVMTDTILDGPERALGDLASIPLHDLPVVKRFVRGSVANSTKHSQMLFEMLREADGLARTMKIYQEEGRFADAVGIRQDNIGKLNARKRLRSIQKKVAKVNKELNRVALSRTIKPEARERRLDQLRKQKNLLTKQIEPLIDFF